MLRSMLTATAVTAALLTVCGAAKAAGAQSDADYIAQVSTGAPAAVVKSATIVQMSANGTMRTLQTGDNGFTCLMMGPQEPMCADNNAMAWMKAILSHGAPPASTGFVYMLAGDQGASDSDPYASAQSASNHWVKTGPHVMILTPTANSMGYPMGLDPDPTKPYVMWPNTPYAHLMIPVTTSP
jgi:hypothetical protein